MSQADPTEEFDDNTRNQRGVTRAAGPVTPIARVLSGVDPDFSEDRAAKQQCRAYDDDTAQRALEAAALRSASERMGIVALDRGNAWYSRVYFDSFWDTSRLQMGSQTGFQGRRQEDLRHHRHLRLVQTLSEGADSTPKHSQRCEPTMCFHLEGHVLGDRTRETRRVQIEHSARGAAANPQPHQPLHYRHRPIRRRHEGTSASSFRRMGTDIHREVHRPELGRR